MKIPPITEGIHLGLSNGPVRPFHASLLFSLPLILPLSFILPLSLHSSLFPSLRIPSTFIEFHKTRVRRKPLGIATTR